jgi:hypothetical protein
VSCGLLVCGGLQEHGATETSRARPGQSVHDYDARSFLKSPYLLHHFTTRPSTILHHERFRNTCLVLVMGSYIFPSHLSQDLLGLGPKGILLVRPLEGRELVDLRAYVCIVYALVRT